MIYIFRKNLVLNICRYLKGFYLYKKTNNIFLKSVESFILKNGNQKHNEQEYKQVWATLNTIFISYINHFEFSCMRCSCTTHNNSRKKGKRTSMTGKIFSNNKDINIIQLNI